MSEQAQSLFQGWTPKDHAEWRRWLALNDAAAPAFAHMPVGAYTNLHTAPSALEIGVMENATQRIMREEAEAEAIQERESLHRWVEERVYDDDGNCIATMKQYLDPVVIDGAGLAYIEAAKRAGNRAMRRAQKARAQKANGRPNASPYSGYDPKRGTGN